MNASRPSWRKAPSLATRWRERSLMRRYRADATGGVFDLDWRAVPYTRAAVVNLLLEGKPAARYLEIGCAGDELFNAVMATDKSGVDPVRGGTHRMTSDAFFTAHPDARFDVIFIDGLHLYDQVRRDLVNALAALNPGGWIALHDMWPRDWLEEHVPQIASSGWTGDGWKVAFELLETPGVDFRLLSLDHGVVVARPAGPGVALADRRDVLSAERFDYFHRNFAALPTSGYLEAAKWIRAAAAQPLARPPGNG